MDYFSFENYNIPIDFSLFVGKLNFSQTKKTQPQPSSVSQRRCRCRCHFRPHLVHCAHTHSRSGLAQLPLSLSYLPTLPFSSLPNSHLLFLPSPPFPILLILFYKPLRASPSVSLNCSSCSLSGFLVRASVSFRSPSPSGFLFFFYKEKFLPSLYV